MPIRHPNSSSNLQLCDSRWKYQHRLLNLKILSIWKCNFNANLWNVSRQELITSNSSDKFQSSVIVGSIYFSYLVHLKLILMFRIDSGRSRCVPSLYVKSFTLCVINMKFYADFFFLRFIISLLYKAVQKIENDSKNGFFNEKWIYFGMSS